MDMKAGDKVFVRTVTYHLIGEVESTVVVEGVSFVKLAQASWVADSGRFHTALADGTLNEVEPVGEAWVNLASITDMFPWKHALPTKAK